MQALLSRRFKEKIYAGIWGFMIGDALGVPYEFFSREEMKRSPATGMTGWGMHSQPPGTWSDDTSLMLCVLENISRAGDTHSLARLFLKWYEEGYHTAHGEVFDIGVTTRQALERLKSGVTAAQAGMKDEQSAGNGSLMRCLPYAFADNFSQGAFQMIRDNQITHRVALCQECCLYYIRMARSLAEGYSKQEAFLHAGGYLRAGWRIADYEENKVDYRNRFGRLFSDTFFALPEETIPSSGYVIETLEAVVWCFMNGTDYRSCVLKAVNLGGDTDTIAALTGGLAGIFYGTADITPVWSGQMVNEKKMKNRIQRYLGLDESG